MSTIPHYNLVSHKHFQHNPVGPAALPFFIILRTFKISSLLISSQGPSTFHRLWHYPMCSPHSAVFHILSLFFLHLIIFYQHFSICIFHTIYSYYILSGFCHLLCNPVDIFLSCCTLQLINKLLPCLFLCKRLPSTY